MTGRRIAAFIITYERPAEATSMIAKLFEQTLVPEKILIIDNSDSYRTQELILSLNDRRVEYIRVGYNSGPAGAAHIGLKLLAEQGFDWIYWGDDDDPPETSHSFNDVFEVLSKTKYKDDEVGIIGKAGGRLNRLTGRTLSFKNAELKGIIEADYIAGNKMMIVNSMVVKANILPNPLLFFGFEELDFCLRVSNNGFRILFDGSKLLKQRVQEGKTASSYRWKGHSFGIKERLWRQYYSTRNLLFVLRANRFWSALILQILRTVTKSIYGFRYGWSYGIKQFRIQALAMIHFSFGRFGQTNLAEIIKEKGG
jgi:GT2 family glycosyltransferase